MSEGKLVIAARKITIKDVMGDMAAIWASKLLPPKDAAGNIPKIGEYVALMNVAGIAMAGKPGTTSLGDFIKFKGDFIATNLFTDEAYQSSSCIVPQFLADQIYFALRDAEGATVQFAFQFLARHNQSAAVKYEYKAVSLLEMRPTNAMANLLDKLQGQRFPALAAPLVDQAVVEKAKADTEAKAKADADAKAKAEADAKKPAKK